MPLYEYQCGNCGERHERLERLSAPRVHACPRCGADMHRLLGVPALQFKGSGWYVTDYGKGGRVPSSPAKTEQPPKDGSSSDAA